MHPQDGADPHDKTARRLNGDAPAGIRPRDDFYPTPPEGTEALLRVEAFDGPIWEPACGDGAICKVLERSGYQVIASDLVSRGYGESRIDFLLEWTTRAPNIVTNPPFNMALEFADKSLRLASRKIALLVQLRFLEGIERGAFFDRSPPTRVWVFKRRLFMPSADPDGTRGGMMAFAWFVWDHRHEGPPVLGWI
jgi:hypothetical protein